MYIQELCKNKKITIERCDTDDQAADMLTKSLSKLKVKRFREMIGMVENNTIGGSVGIASQS